MALLTLTQAAKTAGVARSTLYRAIRKGRVSVISRANGNKGIDTRELQRVFGALQGTTEPKRQQETQKDAALLRAHIDALEQENKLLDVVSRGLLEGPKGKRRKGKKKGH